MRLSDLLNEGRLRAQHGVLKAAAAVLAAAGYRAAASSYHATVFAALPMIMDDARELARFLDICRRKRNRALYDRVGAVSEDEVQELTDALTELLARVKQWLRRHHPRLYPADR